MHPIFSTNPSTCPQNWHSYASLNEELTLIFFLHPEKKTEEKIAKETVLLATHPSNRNYINKNFNATKVGIKALRKFVKDNCLKISSRKVSTGKIEVKGKVADFNRAFNVQFSNFKAADGNLHTEYLGCLKLPETLVDHVLHIGNLEEGRRKARRGNAQVDTASTTGFKGYTPKDISTIYNFPGNDAAGECIGVIELGGSFSQEDLSKYCEMNNLPIPEVVIVGAEPKAPPSAQMVDNIEVTMDIELIAGLAPKAKIVLYYAKSVNEGIHSAINDITNKPSVLSISWALSEYDLTPSENQKLTLLCQQAAQKGITLVAASGDYGAYNKRPYLNVMSPASNPLVLGVGGTALYPSNGHYQEIVWFQNLGSEQTNGSGGGYSQLYQSPSYQKTAINFYRTHYFATGGISRGVPDVAANASSQTPYQIVFKDKILAIGSGTSAATPVWAALIARLNKALGYRLGYINEWLYKLENSKAFNPVVSGNNGYYPVAPGWSPTTGLGTPNGKELLYAIKALIPK